MHLAALAHSPQLLGGGLVASAHERVNTVAGQVFADQGHEVVEPHAVTTQWHVHSVIDTIRPPPALLRVRCRVVSQTYGSLYLKRLIILDKIIKD